MPRKTADQHGGIAIRIPGKRGKNKQRTRGKKVGITDGEGTSSTSGKKKSARMRGKGEIAEAIKLDENFGKQEKRKREEKQEKANFRFGINTPPLSPPSLSLSRSCPVRTKKEVEIQFFPKRAPSWQDKTARMDNRILWKPPVRFLHIIAL